MTENSLDIKWLLEGEHCHPHRFLGIHGHIYRVWNPGKSFSNKDLKGKVLDQRGLVEYDLRQGDMKSFDFKDPYLFSPTLGEQDCYFFSKGTHYEIYRILGAHVACHENVWGVKVAVWAPRAKRVSVVGDFNQWNGLAHPMRRLEHSDLFELFIPHLKEGEKYKFEIKTFSGEVFQKADPFAFFSELRPHTASIVFDVSSFSFTDQQWMQTRQKDRLKSPLSIYEIHLPSWRRDLTNYRDLAAPLADYCLYMGFTHVELLAIMEHPLDESWGYQVTGFYAVTSRLGTPSDFQYFVNHLHEKGIGVILDWVPAHFPKDDFALSHFDGGPLFEHPDFQKGYHPHWHSAIFNYESPQVVNFLIGSALFWLDVMHIDGLRIDAVASMLYLDYGRNEGEWTPNCWGGNENLEAIEFLKHLNATVHEKFPGVLMIAEESTAFPKVSHPLHFGGLGFDFKWNMGWMNDTLCYFEKDPIYRQYHQHQLTFGLLYAFSENFILPFSHDEVVHEKKSLLSKMPGDEWQRFAELRLLFSYQICQPGKKLFFMGGELGQYDEWDCKGEMQWFLLKFPYHHGLQKCLRALNHFYLTHPALYERDTHFGGFEWVDFQDHSNSVISYLRKSETSTLLCVHNFSPNFFPSYTLYLARVNKIREVFSTDAEEFGGSHQLNLEVHVKEDRIHFKLAPLATMIFELT